MLDFMTIATKTNKKTETTDVYPKFIMRKSKDLMVRGRDFYAIWDDEQKMWSTDEDDATRLIDNELRNYVEPMKTSSMELLLFIICGMLIVGPLISFINIARNR